MPERRARLDYAALALLLAGLLVALSVFSYDPADPPSPVVHPQRPTVTNLLGVPGAWLGRVLVETFGVAAYVLLASWFVLVVLLFVRRSLLTWTLRLAGWLLLVPCAAAAADFVGSPLLPGSLNGGGTLGAWLIGWLQASFYPVGQVAVYSGCLFLGLVLTADSAVSRVLKAMWRACCWMMRASFRASRWLWTRIRTRRTPRETSNTETKPVIKRSFQNRSARADSAGRAP